MANTYLYRDATGSTHVTKATISCWVKRANIGSEQHIWFSGNTSDYGQYSFRINFNADDTLRCMNDDEGTNFKYETNRKFRDTFGYYHICLTLDQTNGTAADRAKLWINGVRETSFSTQTNMSGSRFLTGINGYRQVIGRHEGGSDAYLDGVLSHYYYIDGTAYDADVFGEEDASTGEWKIKTSPSVTMGTNGFTVLKDGNTYTDQSSNSNDLTLGGGSVTKTEDCPSNIFCTWNFLTRDATGSGDKFNLYYGNTEARSPSVGGSVMHPIVGNIGLTKGKWYWEALYVSGNSANHIQIGITSKIRHTNAQYNQLGALPDDYSYHGNNGDINNNNGGNNAGTSYGNTYAAGDYIGVFMDLDNNKIYFSKNGTVQNSGTGHSITAAADTHDGCYYPAFSDYHYAPTYICQANFGNGCFGNTQLTGTTYNGADGNGIFKYDPTNVTLDGVSKSFNAISTKGLNA